jgi:hypothetical protein
MNFALSCLCQAAKSALERRPIIGHHEAMATVTLSKRRALPASMFLLLTILLMAGCVSYKVRQDGIARAGLNETVYVDGLRVTPLKLLEDSRCPAKVQCVWAGRIRIEVRIDLGSRSEMRELTLGEPITVADGSLDLVEVYPEAKADRSISPEDYRFGFRFAGGI